MRLKSTIPYILILVQLSLLVACGELAGYDEGPPPEPGQLGRRLITVQAKSVWLNPGNPDQTKIGGLTFLKGWALTSNYGRFGGFSGLSVQGQNFTAITDRGDWLTATVDWFSEDSPLSNTQMMPFSQGTSARKVDLDAESLVRAQYGFLVGFEQNHRILHVWEPGAPPAKPTALNFPALRQLSSNSGIEALALHPVGGALLFAEYGDNRDGNRNFWQVDESGPRNRGYKAIMGHAPTDAAILPNGDVLVLNRNYSPVDGVSVIVSRIPNARIIGEGPLEGRKVARLRPPLSVDNMEALVLVGEDQGKPVLAMMSDDNFRSTQRTLLLLFRLDAY